MRSTVIDASSPPRRFRLQGQAYRHGRPDAGVGLGHDRCQRGLADLKRTAPQVIAVQLDQAEGVKEYTLVSAVVPDEFERGDAI